MRQQLHLPHLNRCCALRFFSFVACRRWSGVLETRPRRPAEPAPVPPPAALVTGRLPLPPAPGRPETSSSPEPEEMPPVCSSPEARGADGRGAETMEGKGHGKESALQQQKLHGLRGH